MNEAIIRTDFEFLSVTGCQLACLRLNDWSEEPAPVRQMDFDNPRRPEPAECVDSDDSNQDSQHRQNQPGR